MPVRERQVLQVKSLSTSASRSDAVFIRLDGEISPELIRAHREEPNSGQLYVAAITGDGTLDDGDPIEVDPSKDKRGLRAQNRYRDELEERGIVEGASVVVHLRA